MTTCKGHESVSFLEFKDSLSACECVQSLQPFVTPWSVACQSPSMEFSRQEYWSGWPCPPPGDLPNPGIKPRSPMLQADSLPPEPAGKPTIIYIL